MSQFNENILVSHRCRQIFPCSTVCLYFTHRTDQTDTQFSEFLLLVVSCAVSVSFLCLFFVFIPCSRLRWL